MFRFIGLDIHTLLTKESPPLCSGLCLDVEVFSLAIEPGLEDDGNNNEN